MRKVIALKLVSSILLLTLVFSAFSVISQCNVNAAYTPRRVGYVYGYVYLELYDEFWTIPWATVHIINQDGDEITMSTSWKGTYQKALPPGDYKAYATLAWYSSEEKEFIIERGNTQINFILEYP